MRRSLFHMKIPGNDNAASSEGLPIAVAIMLLQDIVTNDKMAPRALLDEIKKILGPSVRFDVQAPDPTVNQWRITNIEIPVKPRRVTASIPLMNDPSFPGNWL